MTDLTDNQEWDEENNTNQVPGIYKHYKGDLYKVLFVAWESTNDRDRESLVVYISLKTGVINSRRQLEFVEFVKWDDGEFRPRFCKRDVIDYNGRIFDD